MNKLITAIIIILFSSSAYSNDSITGDVWVKLSDESKIVLIVGYNTGVTAGAVTAAMEALRLYSPSKEKGVDLLIPRNSTINSMSKG